MNASRLPHPTLINTRLNSLHLTKRELLICHCIDYILLLYISSEPSASSCAVQWHNLAVPGILASASVVFVNYEKLKPSADKTLVASLISLLAENKSVTILSNGLFLRIGLFSC